jgi:hypothetical protein
MGHVRRARRRTETILNRQSLPTAPDLLKRLEAIHGQIRAANRLVPNRVLSQAQARLALVRIEANRDATDGVRSNGTITGGLTAIYQQLSRVLVESRPKPAQAAQDEREELGAFLQQASEKGWYRKPPEKLPKMEDGFEQSIDFIRSVSIASDQLLPREESFGLVRAPLLLLRRVPQPVMYGWTRDPSNYRVYVVFGYYALILDVLFVGIDSTLLWTGTPRDVRLDTDKFDDIVGFMARGAQIPRDGLITAPRAIGGHHYCPILDIDSETNRYFVDWDIPRK